MSVSITHLNGLHVPTGSLGNLCLVRYFRPRQEEKYKGIKYKGNACNKYPTKFSETLLLYATEIACREPRISDLKFEGAAGQRPSS